MARRIDRRLGDLLERLGRGPDFQDACTAVLHHLLVSSPAGRGLIVARAGDLVRGSGWRVAPEIVKAAEAQARDRDSWLARALNGGGPGEGVAVDGLDPSVTLDFESGDFDGRGVLLAEGLDGEDVEHVASAVLERCSPFLVRALELEALRVRVAQLEKERNLRSRMVEDIPDPVLLTDSEANIVTANARAHELFSSSPDDGEGRARAVRLNVFLLSARLTEAAIPGTGSTRRELNLIDPRDGRDLLFEMRTDLLATEGEREKGYLVTVLRDVTDVKRASEELGLEFRRSRAAEHRARQESRRLQAILENVAEPILVTDPRSRIVLMNREAERLFEVEAQDQGPEERAPVRWTNVSRLSSFVSDLTLSRESRSVETLVLLDPAEGEEFPVEATAVKLEDERGEATAVVTVLRDLTPVVENERLAQALRALNQALEGRIEKATAELEERNRILEWQGRELERASELKSQFLANMSHELRTPINAMLGYVSLLQEGIFGSMNEGQEGALEKMEAAAEHLLDLINDILDLSRIEAGKMPVRSDKVDLPALVSELRSTIGLLIGDRRVRLVADISDEVGSMETDRTKLRQVLLNLLENAVKFTEEGSVTLRIRPATERDRLRFEVEDTGVGMSPEELEHVFEDFRQGDQSRTRAHGGAGLGLSISRRLVGLLGGRISVDSVLGEGTTFVVDLPTVLPNPALESGRTERAEGGLPARSGESAEPTPNAVDDEDSRSDISHGLKNPLQGIVGYAELMEMGRYGDLDPSIREVIEKIAQHGRQMSGRLDVAMGLLTLAADAAREPTGHTVSLSEAARHAVRRLLDEASERGMDLEIAMEDGVLHVPGTPDRLVTLLLALLRLGLEGAGPGRLRLVAEDEGDGTVRLWMERIGDRGEKGGDGEEAPDGTRLEKAVLRLLAEGVGGRVRWHDEEADPVPEVWLPLAGVEV